MQKSYVLCANATIVPGSVLSTEDRVVTVKYVFQKTEYTQQYVPSETFEFSGGAVVYLLVQRVGEGPCMIPLPPPFNQLLKMGSTLLFQMNTTVDFVVLWNDCCSSSLTWQHNRPKKMTDPSQKLGLPAKLNEYLREQVGRHGLTLPVGSDVSDEDTGVNEALEHSASETDTERFSSEADAQETDEDYYSSPEEDDNEDLEEEEEVEEEPEPDELLEDE